MSAIEQMMADAGAQPSPVPMFGQYMLVRGNTTAFLSEADPRFDPELVGAVRLDSINIVHRGTPMDTLAALRAMTQAADAHGIKMYLDVHPYNVNARDKLPEKRDLVRLYKRYGFVQPRANSRQFVGYDRMIRTPRGRGLMVRRAPAFTFESVW